jgi:hypothetical protein
MTRIDEGEPAIIGWRICDAWDPWVPLYLRNAEEWHGHGDLSCDPHAIWRCRYLIFVMKKYLAAAWRDGSGGPITLFTFLDPLARLFHLIGLMSPMPVLVHPLAVVTPC